MNQIHKNQIFTILAMLSILAVQLLMPVSYAEGVCGKLLKANDLLDCVRKQSPSVQGAQAQYEAALSIEKSASRWLNPELSAQSVFGNNLGNQQNQTQLALIQTIELSGQRSGRVQAGQAGRWTAQGEAMEAVSQEVMESGLKLIRIGQLKREKESLNEAIQAYTKLIQQFQNRPRLSSEQEVSLVVFKLAKGDFLLQQGKLQDEEDEVSSAFKQALSLELEELLKIAPEDFPKTPEVSQIKQLVQINNSEKAPEMMRAKGAWLLSESMAKTEAWGALPEIKLGPTVQFNVNGPMREQYFGFQLTMPFPVWNQNGHAREVAQKNLFAQEKLYQITEKKIPEDKLRLLKSYERHLMLLEQTPSQKEMSFKHEKIERLFFQGLVSSALVIEAHRSLMEVQKSRHQAELNVLKTLWSIYKLEGKTSEIQL